MTGAGPGFQTDVHRKLKKRRIWVRDPNNANRMIQEWVADEATEKGAKQLAKEEWAAMKKSQKPGKGLSLTWRPNQAQRLWVQLIAHHLRQMGVPLKAEAIEVDIEATMNGFFEDPARMFEVVRRLADEDQTEALRALPARYISERVYRELAAERAKIMGWYAERVQSRAQKRP